MSRINKSVLLALLVVMAGCSTTPSTRIAQPMTAKPVEPKMVLQADGSIFHPGVGERPLFEDRRARNVGDIITINIVEKTAGNKKTSNGSNFSSDTNASFPTLTGRLSNVLTRPFTGSAVGTSTNKSSNSTSGSASEDMIGTITVTVIQVLGNGNLLVSGEKHVALNNSDEFIRFSGVVNPNTITGGNVVLSNQVADAHIEYKTAGALNEFVNDAASGGILGRFFQSVTPF